MEQPMVMASPQPAAQAPLPPLAVERTSRLISQQRGRADALIEVLHQVQELYGYLPVAALAQVARELKLPLSRVHGMASFYHLFRLEAPTAQRWAVCGVPWHGLLREGGRRAGGAAGAAAGAAAR
ncbi:MAG: NAD(P)H-dependent oxidoreductase subunit E [Cyanobium sp.]